MLLTRCHPQTVRPLPQIPAVKIRTNASDGSSNFGSGVFLDAHVAGLE
jgi:hypothetical protein